MNNDLPNDIEIDNGQYTAGSVILPENSKQQRPRGGKVLLFVDDLIEVNTHNPSKASGIPSCTTINLHHADNMPTSP